MSNVFQEYFVPATRDYDDQPLPVLNAPLLRKVLDHIDAHPEEWDQNYWGKNYRTLIDLTPATHAHDLYYFHTRLAALEAANSACGTAYCIAGHALHQAGYQLHWNGGRLDSVSRPDDDRPVSRDIQKEATRLLGLTAYEAHDLFVGGNTRATIDSIVFDILAARGLSEL